VADEAIAKEAAKVFSKQGLKIEVGVKSARLKRRKPLKFNILQQIVQARLWRSTG